VACTTSTNSLSSALSSCDTYLIRSITPTSSSLSLSLKTSVISRLLIRGAVLPSLFALVCAKWLIILKHPLLLQAQWHTHTVAFILSSSKVILLCSCCAKKGLVYVMIAALSSRQSSSCSECTSINMRSSCNIYSVSNAEYMFYISYCCLYLPCLNKNTWCHAALLALLYTF